ncbi:hypothetical protein ACWCQW_55940 [Streptomyces mirabilis]
MSAHNSSRTVARAISSWIVAAVMRSRLSWYGSNSFGSTGFLTMR